MGTHTLKKLLDDRFPGIFQEITESYLPKTILTDANAAAASVKPTVVIGLGGSGVKAVARLKWRIYDFYRGGGFENEKKSIGFQVMDTLSYGNIQKEDPEAARFIYRVIGSDEYTYLGGFNPGEYLKNQRHLSSDLQTWWDDQYPPPQLVIEDGAKRVRQLGRLALYRNRGNVRTAIRKSINEVVQLYQSLVQQGKIGGFGDDGVNLQFYIFSGTCGGTGSGMVTDVIYQCYSLAKELGRIPIIRLVLFMPRLFIEAQRKRPEGEWLAKAYEANAYAFFKELQYLIDASGNFYDWRMDAKEQQGQDARPYEGWKPDRVYLVDTELAGKWIGVGEFNQIYTLAADYIFQIMVTPAGYVLEQARGTNIDEALKSNSGGHPNAFSSFGISYIMYPSKTISRSLSLHLMRDVIAHLLKNPLSKEERGNAQKEAGSLYASLGDHLIPERIDQHLLTGMDLYMKVLPDGAHILQRMENEKAGAQELLQKAHDTGETQGTLGKNAVNQNYQSFREDALHELERGIKEALTRHFHFGFEALKEILSHFKASIEGSKSQNIPGTPIQAARDFNEALQRISALEKQWIVWRKGKKISEAVHVAARKQKEETDLTIRGYASERRNSYLADATKVVEELTNRVKRIEGLLNMMKDDLNERCRDSSLEYDETSVSVTTQFVPIAPNYSSFENLYKEAAIDLKKFIDDLFTSSGMPESLWSLGDAEENESKELLTNFFKKTLGRCVEKIGRPWLGKKVTDIIQEKWKDKLDVFRETYGKNLLNLADPSWALNKDWIPAGEARVIPTDPVCAYYFKEDFRKDEALPEALQGEVYPGDSRSIVVLRSEHAAPLFSVRGIMMLKDVYKNWMASYRERQDAPPHIHRDWNKSEGALEDLWRKEIVGTEEQGVFAMGLFLDWLVREKNDLKILGILGDKNPTGPVFKTGVKGAYQYASFEERAGKKLHKKGTISLGTVKRNEAAQKIDAPGREAIQYFLSKTEDVIPPQELRILIDEYLDYLKGKNSILSGLLLLGEREREQKIKAMPDERQRNLYRQLLKEAQMLMNYKKDLEEGA